MANKDLVSTTDTLVAPPPEGSQVVAQLTPSARYSAGKDAIAKLASADAAGFDSLNQSAKDAFTAYGLLPSGDEREPSAKAAALDALRDAKAAGTFSTSPTPVNHVAESKDHAVRNQAPTGTPGESSGPAPVFAPSSPPPATPVTGDPNTTTPAVKGQSKT